MLEVDLTVHAAAEYDTPNVNATPSTLSVVAVVVPDGCFDGDFFTVEFDGRQFTIGVPQGCGPGDEIEVEVPPEDAPREQRTPPAELVGRRCELCGLVAKGILNGRKGVVRAYDAEKELLSLAVDGMCPDVSVRWANVRELPASDEPDPDDDEPPEAPPAGVHYVGDRVHVARSSGRTSLGTVVEYDEVFESYVVDVGHGILKYGVEESDLTPYETSSEWAGPAQRVNGRWEGHFVGRRVRVPAMLNSSGDEDKNGSVEGYEARTGFYHVLLDNGVMRRSVLYKQMKVLYQLDPDGGGVCA